MVIIRAYKNLRCKKPETVYSLEVIHNNKLLEFYPKLCKDGLKNLLKIYDHSLIRFIKVLNAKELNISNSIDLD